jgi:hypothetical protein
MQNMLKIAQLVYKLINNRVYYNQRQ